MTGKLQFQFDFAARGEPRRKETACRRILMLGDYSGETPGKPELSARRPHAVDVDNFDSLMARMNPQLRISLDGETPGEEVVEFRQPDDFHPDALFRRLAIFEPWRALRERLENPSTYQAAAEELKHGRFGQIPPPAPTEGAVVEPAAPGTPDEAGLFERLIGAQGPQAGAATKPRPDFVQDLIRRIVEPHPGNEMDLGQQRQLLSTVDDAITRIMRQILHQPDFQALEAVWRGSEWLLGDVEQDDEVRLFLLDASRDELMLDMDAAEGVPERTAIHRLLTESSLAIAGGEPWSLIIGLARFGDDARSLDLLELLGSVSAACDGLFIAEASPRLLGCGSLANAPNATDWGQPEPGLAQRWRSLRGSRFAGHIALSLPRFMLRRPYGTTSEPTESFRFEEMPGRPPHESYLWGSPALPCALLVARGWLEDEPRSSRFAQSVDGLPYHVFDDGDGQRIKPCAEVCLNENSANAIVDAGIIPLLSVKNENLIAIPRLSTIAEPATGTG